MLQELHLRGLGVIAEATVSFSPGLNVVTGETGVGKTLLVTSLQLLCGGRGTARLVGTGADEAVVEAVVTETPTVREQLDAAGLHSDGEVVIVRRLGSDGRSRAWLAGQLVPLSTLTELGEGLVEMHGQGAGFALARPAVQLASIDALARNEDIVRRYRAALDALRTTEAQLADLRTDRDARERELDLLSFQADEIERAALESGEEDRVSAAIARLDHAERLQAVAAEVLSLAGAEGAAGALGQAHKLMQTAAAIDPGAAELVDRLAGLALESGELSRDLWSWSETLEADPAQLESLRERKALIGDLKRKYGATIEEIVAFGTSAQQRAHQLAGSDDRIAKLETDRVSQRETVDALATELSARRRRAAEDLTRLVGAELPALGLAKAVFTVEIEAAEQTSQGADRVAFMFSSSKAKPQDAIGKIASGGELSRAMIAVSLALAQSHNVPVMVFDEADQGVGGEAALELGRRLARLGSTHQVLVVSHLPQIAAFADRHIVVRRADDAVDIRTLDDEERRGEISRMLAGLESSDLARAHAVELLELAASERAAMRAPARAG